MANDYSVGDKVKWQWGSGWARGEIKERFTQRTTRTLRGTEVVRDATPENPAYLIAQSDEDEVLKGHSELSRDA